MRFSAYRFINILLLGVVLLLALTGTYGLFWTLQGWVFDLHRFAGWLLVALIPSKAAISMTSLRRGLRPNVDRGAMVILSSLLAGLTLLVIALGVAWLWRLMPGAAWLRQTLISWHWMLGLGLLVPFLLHVWNRWPRPRKVDFLSRRGALKLIGATAAALGLWVAGDRWSNWQAQGKPVKRFTGSRRAESYSGNRFPVTNNPGEGETPIDVSTWKLRLSTPDGKQTWLAHDELFAIPHHALTATLDCTLGWYSTQTWQGIPLPELIRDAGYTGDYKGVEIKAVSGYRQIFEKGEVKKILLATHVGGEVLSHVHGFPLRAVVPSRRGWFWVKWISEIRVL